MPKALTLENDVDWQKIQADKLAELSRQTNPYAEQETRLAKREAGMAGDKDMNIGMALMRAGATMAGTPGNLGQSLSQGAMAGIDEFSSGMKDIRAREDRNFDARTSLIGLEEGLKAKRTEESYKYAQGMQTAETTRNNIKSAEYNAAIARATLQQQINSDNAKREDNKLARASQIEVAKIGAGTQSAETKTAQAALNDPALKKMLLELASTGTVAQTQKTIAARWSSVQGKFLGDQGGGSVDKFTTEDWQGLTANMAAELVGMGYSAGHARVLAEELASASRRASGAPASAPTKGTPAFGAKNTPIKNSTGG
jgi:hypothetical protein